MITQLRQTEFEVGVKQGFFNVKPLKTPYNDILAKKCVCVWGYGERPPPPPSPCLPPLLHIVILWNNIK